MSVEEGEEPPEAGSQATWLAGDQHEMPSPVDVPGPMKLRYRGLRGAGQAWERLAARELSRAGYEIVARNYRLPSGDGEADLIAWGGRTLVFVELKSRDSAARRT